MDYQQVAPEEAALTGMAIAVYAAQRPSEHCLHDQHRSLTWQELNAACNQLGRHFRGIGLEPGDDVALLCSNRAEYVIAFMAAYRTGMRTTPINWHLTGEEIGYIVDNSDARIFVADSRFADKAAEAASHSDKLLDRLAIGGDINGFNGFEAALAQHDAANIEDAVLGRSMLYTSGTTGRPKGVYREAQPPVLPSDDLEPGDVDLCMGPAYHAAPLLIDVLTPLISGAAVVFMDRFDPEEVLQLIERRRVTHCHMVATMFHRLLQLPEETRAQYDVSSLKAVWHGAAPCPVHVKRAMIDWFGPILNEYYAATEGGGGFNIDSHEWLRKPGSVGKPGPEFDNKILDDDGNEVAQGEVGTIYMRAPEVGRFEYYKDRGKTESSYRGDYFTLGDMGYFDEDGYLFLTGRTAELIISGGVNIYPQEVDSEIMKHPAVLDLCTVGVPNDEWGEEVKTVVQLREGIDASAELAEELITFARSRLPGFKVPRSIDFVDDLPRLPTGKIQRRLVRAPYWEGRDKQI